MLAIFDDIFPVELSSWRLAEVNAYLYHFSGSQVYSTWQQGLYGNLYKIIEDWQIKNPILVNRITDWNQPVTDKELGYSLFLNGTSFFLPKFQQHNLPFVFCLYPGGGAST